MVSSNHSIVIFLFTKSYLSFARQLKVCILAYWASKPLYIVAYFSLINIFCGPTFFYLVLPFKWSERDVKSMFQCFLVFFKKMWPLSITSISSSKDSNVHLPHYYSVRALFIIVVMFACSTCASKMFSWTIVG